MGRRRRRTVRPQRDPSIAPFYKVVYSFLKRTIASDTAPKGLRFNFSVSSTQFQALNSSAPWSVLLRVAGTRQEEKFTVAVNGTQMSVGSRTVDVKPFLKWRTNTIRLDGRFSGDVQLRIDWVERASRKELLAQRNKEKRHSPAQSKSLVANALKLDASGEVSATTAIVSLKCPLGKARLEIPCRGVNCVHLQCFDAIEYLKLNESRPHKWSCPVCSKPVNVTDMRIDELWQEILERVPPFCEEVEFYEDGSWTAVDDESSVIVIEETPVKRPMQDVSFIDLTNDSFS